MDWPSRSLRSRIAWVRLALGRRRSRRHARGLTERLHRFDRSGDRLPLFVLVATDRHGHAVHVAAYDAEEYDL
jgi:hypothetical protein